MISRVIVTPLLLVLAAVSCAGDGLTDSPVRPATVDAVVLADSNALIRRFSVSLSRATGIVVEYWTEGGPRLQVSRETNAVSHDVLLARLLSDHVYEYEVRSVTADGMSGVPFNGTFTTAPLPPELAEIEFVATGEPTVPLVLLEIRSPPFSAYVIVDKEGQVVWFWPAGSPQGSTRLEDGTFVFLDNDSGLVAVTPGLEVLGRVAQDGDGRTVHHDVIAASPSTVLFLANERQTVGTTVWVGEAVWEWSITSGTQTRVWNSFDFFNPVDDLGVRSIPIDWLHANALSFGPRGNLLVSLHFLDQVISIASGFKSIEWRLGGFQTDFGLDAEAVFSGQHTAAEIAPWRVLMFDNGFSRADGSRFSRALELELDTTTATASLVWEFRPSRDNFARIISSARRLENGNTLVAFGTSEGVAGASGPVEVYEVERGGQVIWHLLINGPHSTFRATPLGGISGERLVQPLR